MNIFFLDSSPKEAAKAHCDKHVNKMITEHLQMMSVALDYHGYPPALKKDGTPYSTRAYKNHPCTLWVKESFANFHWLYNLTTCLCREFKFRHGKEHAGLNSLRSIDIIAIGASNKYPNHGHTPPAQAMPDYCKDPDPVVAYRNYYNLTKWEFATWKNTSPPGWWAPACSLSAKNEY